MFKTRTTIPFHLVDPAGIVFFGHAFTMAHQAFEDLLRHHQVDWQDWFEHPELGTPFREARAQYFRPLRGGETYEIQVSVTSMEECAFGLRFEFRQGEQVFCRVETQQVSVRGDLSLGQKPVRAPLSARTREIFGAHLVSS